MASLTSAELLDWLAAKQFLDAAQAAELQAAVDQFADPRLLARELVRRDWVTPYQANQIFQGKGDQLVLGPYLLREKLGEGAMGQVLKGFHPRLRRTVAIKTLQLSLVASPKARERFYREVRLAAQLDHPHIVRALDADEVEGRLFLVMEYVEGTNLSAILKQSGPMPILDAADYIRQAALGLQHAFERGIVHRDIKPSNLMRVGGKPDARPAGDPEQTGRWQDGVPLPAMIKILDFGLARFESEGDQSVAGRLTQFGKILGTVDYMAPEQAVDSRSADIRADIYSLGCTLYTLLSAQPAFAGDDLGAKILARQEGEPPNVRYWRPEAPEALAEVVLKMMARIPADRYQAPAEVAAALSPFTPQPTISVYAGAPVASVAVVAPPTPAAVSVPSVAAVPVAEPVHVDVELPVAAASTAGPEATLAEGAPGTEDLAFTLHDALSAEPRVRRRQPARRGGRAWLIVGAVLLVMVLASAGFALRGVIAPAPPPKKGYFTPGAAVVITDARLSVGDVPMRQGDIKLLLVKIDRQKFDGPVKIAVKDLPEGVSSTPPLLLDRKKSTAEFRLTVATDAEPGKSELKVTAVAENLTDEKTVPVTVRER